MKKIADLEKTAAAALKERNVAKAKIDAKIAETETELKKLETQKAAVQNAADFTAYADTCEAIRRTNDMRDLAFSMQREFTTRPTITAEQVQAFETDCRQAFQAETAADWTAIKNAAKTLRTAEKNITEKQLRLNNSIATMKTCAGQPGTLLQGVATHKYTLAQIVQVCQMIEGLDDLETKGILN